MRLHTVVKHQLRNDDNRISPGLKRHLYTSRSTDIKSSRKDIRHRIIRMHILTNNDLPISGTPQSRINLITVIFCTIRRSNLWSRRINLRAGGQSSRSTGVKPIPMPVSQQLRGIIKPLARSLDDISDYRSQYLRRYSSVRKILTCRSIIRLYRYIINPGFHRRENLRFRLDSIDFLSNHILILLLATSFLPLSSIISPVSAMTDAVTVNMHVSGGLPKA